MNLRGPLSIATNKGILAPHGFGTSNPGPRRVSSLEQHILNEILRDEGHCDHTAVTDVFLLLVLCHSIVIDKRTGKLNSSSPDELALVEGAQRHGGYTFEGKDGEGVITIKRHRDQELLKFHLLHVLEFTSTRKRMSVIVRDLQTD